MRKSLCVAALLLSACGAEKATIDAALSAYNQNRIAEAEAMFSRVARDPAADPADRARALREMARIAWLIDGDAGKSLGLIRAAFAAGGEVCETALLQARILDEAAKAEQLLAVEDYLVGRCPEPRSADSIRLQAADAALDLAVDPARRQRAIERAGRLLASAGEEARTGLHGSAIALQLHLLQGDAAAALRSWKDYFWLSGADLPQAMRRSSRPATPIFTAALAPAASPRDRLALVDLLVRAGFALEAERFAAAAGLPGDAAADPLWRKASAYFDARRELERTILASNRRVARGGKAADLEAAVDRARTRLAAAAGLTGDPAQAIREAYGLYGTVGDTGGYGSVHLGHVVQDERRRVEQYGHRASVGFLALDNMIANGFESWLWDGSAAAGGWTEPGPVIVQVRPGYTSGPLNAWALFSGGSERQRLLTRQAEQAATDAAAIEAEGVAFMPGLSDRLRIQVAEQVGARARSLAGAGGDLRRAFLDEYWRATFQQSILTHEGRHALDRALVRGLPRLLDSNLEYRAKLSELALADYPRLALLNINDRTVGGDTPHGKANGRVLQAYARWIEENGRNVAGFDPALPAMVQIEKLSDPQIRVIARGLDPIAR